MGAIIQYGVFLLHKRSVHGCTLLLFTPNVTREVYFCFIHLAFGSFSFGQPYSEADRAQRAKNCQQLVNNYLMIKNPYGGTYLQSHP